MLQTLPVGNASMSFKGFKAGLIPNKGRWVIFIGKVEDVRQYCLLKEITQNNQGAVG